MNVRLSTPLTRAALRLQLEGVNRANGQGPRRYHVVKEHRGKHRWLTQYVIHSRVKHHQQHTDALLVSNYNTQNGTWSSHALMQHTNIWDTRPFHMWVIQVLDHGWELGSALQCAAPTWEEVQGTEQEAHPSPVVAGTAVCREESECHARSDLAGCLL